MKRKRGAKKGLDFVIVIATGIVIVTVNGKQYPFDYLTYYVLEETGTWSTS